jgi:hypothetical protein
MSQTQLTSTKRLDPGPGAAAYSRWTLGVYDPLVLGFCGTYVWKCPTPDVLAFYDRYVSARHLDVGVGTGYFLDRCRFPSPAPTVALLDLNAESLRHTAHRIRRYHPVSYQGSVLDPVDIDLAPFQSIGVTYMLHCLPGDMRYKARVFEHLKPLMASDGVLFGTTILGSGVKQNLVARALTHLYNRRGFMSNRDDSPDTLTAALSGLRDVQVTVRGCVALFVARA